MRDKGASGKTGGRWQLAAGVGIAVLIAAVSYFTFQPEGQEHTDAELTALVPPEASVPQPPEPEAAAEETAQAPPAPAEEAAAPAEAVAATPPSVDEVRLEADGVAVIAGRAEPGSTVSILVDGEEVARALADGRGAFAAVGVLEPGTGARVMSLRAEAGGAVTLSQEDIILAPVATATAPVETPVVEEQIAEAETPAEPLEEQIAQAETAAEPLEEQSGTDDAVSEAEGVAVADDVPDAAEPVETAETPPVLATPAATGPVATEPAALPAEEGASAAVVAEATPPEDTGAAQDEAADAAQSVAVLRSTAEGVSLLQPSAPIAEQIELDTIGYSDLGEVQLSGRANLGAVEVRVYVNNRTVASLPVDDRGGWRGDLPEVDAGVYTLRVDAVDVAGKVTSRIETPFQREAPEALAAAAAAQQGPVSAVTVQTGDTLWAIARDRYGEGVLFVKVFEANRGSIRDPDLIYPGQVFDLPEQ
jgi:nucleoid-associated protein YgaU